MLLLHRRALMHGTLALIITNIHNKTNRSSCNALSNYYGNRYQFLTSSASSMMGVFGFDQAVTVGSSSSSNLLSVEDSLCDYENGKSSASSLSCNKVRDLHEYDSQAYDGNDGNGMSWIMISRTRAFIDFKRYVCSR